MLRPSQTFQVVPSLPPRIAPLRELAYNLWWAWNLDAVDLFIRLDRDLWDQTFHNPVRMLRRDGHAVHEFGHGALRVDARATQRVVVVGEREAVREARHRERLEVVGDHEVAAGGEGGGLGAAVPGERAARRHFD